MKNNFIYLSLFLSLLTIGCSSQPTNKSAAAPPQSETAPGLTTEVKNTRTIASSDTNTITSESKDSEVIGFLTAIDNNEILAGMHAEDKNPSKPVMDYAYMLQADHNSNYQKTRVLSENLGLTAMDTPAVDELKMKSKKDLDQLNALKGTEYDRAYMDLMIRAHEETLSMIDNKLMSLAQSGDVKSHLIETRNIIMTHLKQAEEIRKGL